MLTSSGDASFRSRRIGTYQIQALIAGDMRQIYRAHDTRLGRVAGWPERS
jgi:hypothetical protein